MSNPFLSNCTQPNSNPSPIHYYLVSVLYLNCPNSKFCDKNSQYIRQIFGTILENIVFKIQTPVASE